jgi:acyl phosphate:glycerol-3-phosphate acyltransferase
LDSVDLSLGLLVLAAYLLGAIPFGLVVGRLRGVDLRSLGSGNIGATNAVRGMGKGWGAVVFGLDALKAAAPILAGQQFLDRAAIPNFDAWIAAIAVAGVSGHIFPIYLRFRGGKGVACAFGAFFALSPIVAFAAGMVYLQILVLTRISGLGSLTATTVMLLGSWLHGDPGSTTGAALAVTSLIWFRHRSNLRELLEEATARRNSRSLPAKSAKISHATDTDPEMRDAAGAPPKN